MPTNPTTRTDGSASTPPNGSSSASFCFMEGNAPDGSAIPNPSITYGNVPSSAGNRYRSASVFPTGRLIYAERTSLPTVFESPPYNANHDPSPATAMETGSLNIGGGLEFAGGTEFQPSDVGNGLCTPNVGASGSAFASPADPILLLERSEKSSAQSRNKPAKLTPRTGVAQQQKGKENLVDSPTEDFSALFRTGWFHGKETEFDGDQQMSDAQPIERLDHAVLNGRLLASINEYSDATPSPVYPKITMGVDFASSGNKDECGGTNTSATGNKKATRSSVTQKRSFPGDAVQADGGDLLMENADETSLKADVELDEPVNKRTKKDSKNNNSKKYEDNSLEGSTGFDFKRIFDRLYDNHRPANKVGEIAHHPISGPIRSKFAMSPSNTAGNLERARARARRPRQRIPIREQTASANPPKTFPTRHIRHSSDAALCEVDVVGAPSNSPVALGYGNAPEQAFSPTAPMSLKVVDGEITVLQDIAASSGGSSHVAAQVTTTPTCPFTFSGIGAQTSVSVGSPAVATRVPPDAKAIPMVMGGNGSNEATAVHSKVPKNAPYGSDHIHSTSRDESSHTAAARPSLTSPRSTTTPSRPRRTVRPRARVTSYDTGSPIIPRSKKFEKPILVNLEERLVVCYGKLSGWSNKKTCQAASCFRTEFDDEGEVRLERSENSCDTTWTRNRGKFKDVEAIVNNNREEFVNVLRRLRENGFGGGAEVPNDIEQELQAS